MPRVLLVLVAALFCLGPVPLAAGQDPKSPYAGQQERGIKALSVRDINDYEQGRGMGLAKAAELNHLLAHLRMKRVLSQEQVVAYDGLRGYLGKSGGDHQGSGSKHHGQP